MLALCARYQLRPVGSRAELQPEPHGLRRRLAGQPTQQPDRFASVPQQSLVHRAPPHAAGRGRVERVEDTALRLPAHERQRRPSERQVSRRAARRPVEQPRHQCKTRRRIVAHRRDLRLSRCERAFDVQTRFGVTAPHHSAQSGSSIDPSARGSRSPYSASRSGASRRCSAVALVDHRRGQAGRRPCAIVGQCEAGRGGSPRCCLRDLRRLGYDQNSSQA